MEEALRILIIDDDEVDRMFIEREIKSSSYNCRIEEACDAGEGRELLMNNEFDCVFLDYLLPDQDGLSFLKSLSETGVSSPIILMTGQADEQKAIELIHAGAIDYLPKSNISSDTLTQSIHRAMLMRKAGTKKKDPGSANITRDLLENISDAFLYLDSNWNVSFVNTTAETLLKAERDTLIGKNIWDEAPVKITQWFGEAMKVAKNNNSPVNAQGFYSPLGIWMETNIYPAKEGLSIYLRDITEKEKVKERLHFLAYYDALTGLPNRKLFLDRMAQALTRLPWRHRVMGILYCNLDRFKVINDSLGHQDADNVLMEIAERIKSSIRSGDTAARLGGDEYAIMLNDMAKADDIGQLANKIINSVSAPIQLGDHEIFANVSIGISIAPTDGIDPVELLKNSNTAMYSAKEQGKNSYQIYSPEMNARTSNRLLLESALRHALELEEFQVYYQPKVNLNSHRIAGAEALVRWVNPERGIVSPGEFLPLAEETGLIKDIDEWVLKTSCRQIREWLDAGLPEISIAVNLSNEIFRQDNLIDKVSNILKDAGIESKFLEVELTENIVMKNIDHAEATVARLRDLGVTVSIDDFGTGYSSLAHLKRFPIHTLKIDRSFVMDITDNNDDAAIAGTIIAMAQILHLTVIAEGVETEAQKNILFEKGCSLMQGFFFSRPVPADEFEALLRNQSLTI